MEEIKVGKRIIDFECKEYVERKENVLPVSEGVKKEVVFQVFQDCKESKVWQKVDSEEGTLRFVWWKNRNNVNR